MAQIDLNKITKIDKEHNSIHSKVLATYTVFEVDGKKLVQIDTYGKNNREFPEKISQSFQFDEISARFLVNILVKEFNMNYT